jgi:hypothetical protein
MPTFEKTEPAAPVEKTLQGREFVLATDQERNAAFEQAFDYRGDVMLELLSGETIEGYLFNRESSGNPPSVSVLLKGSDHPRHIPYSEVTKLVFSGKDAADGKSYEAWKAKKKAERDAEAKRIEEKMKADGYL